MANRGPDHEETPVIPAVPSDHVKPNRQVAVTHAPPVAGSEDHAPAKTPDAAHPAVKSSEAFANLPVDQKSPDKLKTTIGASANGTLSNDERYAHLIENRFIDAKEEPLSRIFWRASITASYSTVRRYLFSLGKNASDGRRCESRKC